MKTILLPVMLLGVVSAVGFTAVNPAIPQDKKDHVVPPVEPKVDDFVLKFLTSKRVLSKLVIQSEDKRLFVTFQCCFVADRQLLPVQKTDRSSLGPFIELAPDDGRDGLLKFWKSDLGPNKVICLFRVDDIATSDMEFDAIRKKFPNSDLLTRDESVKLAQNSVFQFK